MAFRIGQKVICINAKERPNRSWFGEAPTEGAVYTVARAFVDADLDAVLWLQELPRRFGLGYLQTRFRPAVEDADKLAWAHKLVAPKAKERELISEGVP